MKKSVYDKLEDIPQIDRDENNYVLSSETDQSKPTFGKYILLLDGAHPVQAKNAELLGKESQRETEKQQAVTQAVAPKDAEIQRLTGELQTAKAQPGLPAGHVAVPLEDHQILQQIKPLGDFKDVKAKIVEFDELKQKDEANTRKELFAEAAKAHGLNVEAFAPLAEQQKLHEKLEMRELPDPKKTTEKVKHYFVKGKDAAGADTSAILGDFVKTDPVFKPFIDSLTRVDKKTPRVPVQEHGETPSDSSAASAYVNKMYKSKQPKTE
jgi:hypothetical protein